MPKNYEKCPFYFWFHTAFVKDNVLVLTRCVYIIVDIIIVILTVNLTREELDNPHKSKTWDVFRESLKVELRLELQHALSSSKSSTFHKLYEKIFTYETFAIQSPS